MFRPRHGQLLCILQLSEFIRNLEWPFFSIFILIYYNLTSWPYPTVHNFGEEKKVEEISGSSNHPPIASETDVYFYIQCSELWT